MDILTRYIQSGKKLTNFKIFMVFLTLTVFMVGIVGIRLNYALTEADMQTFLKSIPLIEIENGVITKPEKVVLEQKLAEEQFIVKIDIEHDKADNLPANGIVLTRKNVILTFNGREKYYQLPTQKTVVDMSFLIWLCRLIILNTCVIIGIMMLIALLLGQFSTLYLSSGLLWLIKKETDKDCVRRSSFIGWSLMLGLNVVLLPFGHGFSLIECVGIATLISVFCLVWIRKNP